MPSPGSGESLATPARRRSVGDGAGARGPDATRAGGTADECADDAGASTFPAEFFRHANLELSVDASNVSVTFARDDIAPDDAAIPPLLCASSNGRSPACASLPDGGRSLAP